MNKESKAWVVPIVAALITMAGTVSAAYIGVLPNLRGSGELCDAAHSKDIKNAVNKRHKKLMACSTKRTSAGIATCLESELNSWAFYEL